MKWEYDDGGRSRYFKGSTGDCAVRAIAIATETDYKEVYDRLYEISGSSPRNGVSKKTVDSYMAEIGWVWHATMRVGSGCTTHMRASEIPMGRVVCRLSKHVAAVVDSVLHDTYDCTRGGTRCIYGYWQME